MIVIRADGFGLEPLFKFFKSFKAIKAYFLIRLKPVFYTFILLKSRLHIKMIECDCMAYANIDRA